MIDILVVAVAPTVVLVVSDGARVVRSLQCPVVTVVMGTRRRVNSRRGRAYMAAEREWGT